MCYLWVVCNEDKCCVVTQRAADIRVAWLVYRSHVLRACYNFEAKQSNSSISLFGRRQNKRPGPMWYQYKFNQLHYRLELSIRDKSHLLEEYFGGRFLSNCTRAYATPLENSACEY